MLYLFGGLPGVGKTTLARQLAAECGAAYVRIDTIEQALREMDGLRDGVEGYVLAYRVAADNLRLGSPVVADCVNPIEVTRHAWREVAAAAGCPCAEIEVVCSDAAEHRRRVESRGGDIAGHRLPTWAEVCSREYERWDRERIVVDTAAKGEAEAFAELIGRLAAEVGTGQGSGRAPRV